jgi:hypothetical protein
MTQERDAPVRPAPSPARRNARVVVGADPRAHATLIALLDPRHGYLALADRLRALAHPPHALCRAMDDIAARWTGAQDVPLVATGLRDFLIRSTGAAPDLAGALAERLATVEGATIGPAAVGRMPVPGLLRALVVPTCPDLARCPCRGAAVRAITDPATAGLLRDATLRAH